MESQSALQLSLASTKKRKPDIDRHEVVKSQSAFESVFRVSPIRTKKRKLDIDRHEQSQSDLESEFCVSLTGTKEGNLDIDDHEKSDQETRAGTYSRHGDQQSNAVGPPGSPSHGVDSTARSTPRRETKTPPALEQMGTSTGAEAPACAVILGRASVQHDSLASRNRFWSQDDQKKLDRVVQDYTEGDQIQWAKAKKALRQALPQRSLKACEDKYRDMGLDTQKDRRSWTLEEDILLLTMRARGETWEEISSSFQARNTGACRTRYSRLSAHM